MGGMPVHISLTIFFSHGFFSHTDPKDFKDGYALRYAGMLGTPTVSTATPSATTTPTATQCGRPYGVNRATFGNNDSNCDTMRCCSERGGRGIIVLCKVPI